MKKMLVVAGAAAALALMGGCRDQATDGSRVNATQPGTGGSGLTHDRDGDGKRLGDGKIGRNNGVIDDGEGPLERDGKSDDKVGKNPGVWNDGEGPLESNPNLNRPEK